MVAWLEQEAWESRSLGSIELEYIFSSSGTAVAAQSIVSLHISQALHQGSPKQVGLSQNSVSSSISLEISLFSLSKMLGVEIRWKRLETLTQWLLCSKLVRHCAPSGATVFRVPQPISSALTTLGTPQPEAFGTLNTVVPLVEVSNYYLTLGLLNYLFSYFLGQP